jgi:hypothetical protein
MNSTNTAPPRRPNRKFHKYRIFDPAHSTQSPFCYAAIEPRNEPDFHRYVERHWKRYIYHEDEQ